ncbi:MAG: recombinase family protein, partial [Roseibium sp.]|uniref:recombinase family protein n=1 Tax=Roseibium sp. TaxID=1936156 RepID=UPI0032985D4E
MPLIGYARVSTDDQSTASQAEELRAAGCTQVYEENASGGDRTRPVLRRLIDSLKPGDVIVVVRLDRLARSLSHLLEVIEGLEANGVHFRSLRDPVDTTSPQGKFTLQVLGAAAELERALIRERTMSGLKSARRAGRVGGNPGLVSGDKNALRKLARARDETHMNKLMDSADQWVALVRRLRPHTPWQDLVKIIN